MSNSCSSIKKIQYLPVVNPENWIESCHAKVRHVSTITNQGVHAIMDTFEVVVVVASALEHGVGENGVVCFR